MAWSPKSRAVSRADRGAHVPILALGRGSCALLAAALLVAGCNPHVQGNGVYREEARNVDPFTGVVVRDGVATHVTAGSPQSVRVIGDSNLLQYVVTQTDPVLAGTTTVPALRISVTERYDATIPLSVVVTVPALSFARAEGSAIEVKKAAAPWMRVEAESGGEVTLIGPGGTFLEVALSSASLDAAYYPVGAADVDLTGSSRADLNSSGPVTGTASGTSIVDNSLNAGPCYVSTTESARTVCH